MRIIESVLLLACIVAGVAGVQTVLRPSLAGVVRSSEAQVPPFTIKWFNQTLDHFNFATQPQNFRQRYVWSGARLDRLPAFVAVCAFSPFAAVLSRP